MTKQYLLLADNPDVVNRDVWICQNWNQHLDIDSVVRPLWRILHRPRQMVTVLMMMLLIHLVRWQVCAKDHLLLIVGLEWRECCRFSSCLTLPDHGHSNDQHCNVVSLGGRSRPHEARQGGGCEYHGPQQHHSCYHDKWKKLGCDCWATEAPIGGLKCQEKLGSVSGRCGF